MTIQVEEKKIARIVKQAVSEVIDEKFEKLMLELIPYVDDDEQREIKEIFGSPDKFRNQQFD